MNKTEQVLFVTALELKQHYGNLRLPITTPNDIRDISKKQVWFDEIEQRFREKVNSFQVPEGLSDESEIQKLREQHMNDVLYSPASINKEELAILSEEDFFHAVKQMNLTTKELAFLTYWFVK
jgi:hypothetical protein